jgi:hypothetical protein
MHVQTPRSLASMVNNLVRHIVLGQGQIPRTMTHFRVTGASNEGTLPHTPQVSPNIVQKDASPITASGSIRATCAHYQSGVVSLRV